MSQNVLQLVSRSFIICNLYCVIFELFASPFFAASAILPPQTTAAQAFVN